LEVFPNRRTDTGFEGLAVRILTKFHEPGLEFGGGTGTGREFKDEPAGVLVSDVISRSERVVALAQDMNGAAEEKATRLPLTICHPDGTAGRMRCDSTWLCLRLRTAGKEANQDREK
jgi:hypothetical protein